MASNLFPCLFDSESAIGLIILPKMLCLQKGYGGPDGIRTRGLPHFGAVAATALQARIAKRALCQSELPALFSGIKRITIKKLCFLELLRQLR